MTKEYINITMSGWNKIQVLFQIISKESFVDKEGNSREVFKCRSNHGDEFFIEDTSFFINNVFNTKNYDKEEHLNLGDTIQKLQNTSSIYTVNFDKIDGTNSEVQGYTIGPDEDFGYTKVFDLNSNHPKNINNRGIKFLILNNIKYTVK